MKNIYQCTNLKLSNLINSNYSSNHQNKEVFYHYITSLIREKTFNGHADERGYVQLSTRELRKVFFNAWISRKINGKVQKGSTKHLLTEVRNDLINWNVINIEREIDEKTKTYSKVKYKLYDNYLYNYQRVDLNNYPSKYSCKVVAGSVFNPKKLNGIHAKVYNLQRKVKLDVQDAIIWVNWAHEKNFKLTPKYRNNHQEDRYMDNNRKSRYLYLIHEFEDYWMFKSPNCDRTFTNLTSFPTVLRQFLYFEDELTGEKKRLTGIDVKNSQPLILSILLKEYYKELGEELPVDVRDYISLTESGELYDYSMKLLVKNKVKFSVNVFKGQFFCNIFYSREKKNSKMRVAFSDEFPNVTSFISYMKDIDYRDLPNQLMRKESEIMERIWDQLLQSNLMFFAVHDCIYVEDSVVVTDNVEKIMEEVFNSYNINPSFH